MTERGAALVAGATGVIGTPLVEQLLVAGWTVYGLSRRTPSLKAGTPLARFVHVQADLSDPRQVKTLLAGRPDISHAFHCVNDGAASMRRAMIANLLDAVEDLPMFSSLCLFQGMKYYGCHLGPFKTPARETDPRIAGCDFYYGEEDLVQSRRQGREWSWVTLRPHAVCGYAAGNPLNLAAAIGIYGALRKARGEDFAFPAPDAGFSSLFQAMDAELLARAAIFVSTQPQCRNQAFNIHNGDVFCWREIWPAFAPFFGLEPGGPSGETLESFFTGKDAEWERIRQEHGLGNFPFGRLARWTKGEYSGRNSRLCCEYDICADVSKLRSMGFRETIGTRDALLRVLERLRRERVIP